MTWLVGLALVASACCAACGQILLKLGVAGDHPLAMINWDMFCGLAFYGMGLILWLYALARLPLSTVYPFATLTLILVGVLSAVVLGDRPSPLACAGYGLIALGLGVTWLGAANALG